MKRFGVQVHYYLILHCSLKILGLTCVCCCETLSDQNSTQEVQMKIAQSTEGPVWEC